jgi:hypothetical protein
MSSSSRLDCAQGVHQLVTRADNLLAKLSEELGIPGASATDATANEASTELPTAVNVEVLLDRRSEHAVRTGGDESVHSASMPLEQGRRDHVQQVSLPGERPTCKETDHSASPSRSPLAGCSSGVLLGSVGVNAVATSASTALKRKQPDATLASADGCNSVRCSTTSDIMSRMAVSQRRLADEASAAPRLSGPCADAPPADPATGQDVAAPNGASTEQSDGSLWCAAVSL